ncbi:MAG: hypothetical protein E3J72_21135 [Planctomycetota bacterium]|nr:MAG: hypothetical protein E3J72_21135 [Planctomycetota bacterium]
MLTRLKKLLFGDKLTVNEIEKERKHTEAERDRLSTRLDMVQSDSDRVFKSMLESRRMSNEARLNMEYERYKTLQDEANQVQRQFMVESRKHSLLSRAEIAFRRAEEKKDNKGFERVMKKLKESNVVEMIARADTEDEVFVAEVDTLLELTEESLASTMTDTADPGKQKLMGALDSIIEAQNEGNFEAAYEHEAEAKKQLRRRRDPLADI